MINPNGKSFYDFDSRALLGAIACKDESMTVQSQGEEADINVIVKRFGLTGNLPQAAMPPTYGDFSVVGDYRSAIEAVRAADASFAAMDASVRSRFDNDPAKFLDFVYDPATSRDDLVKFGLAVPKDKPADVVEPATPKA